MLEKADLLKSSLEKEGAEEIAALIKNLKQAMAGDDPAAIAGLCEELDDILYYVQQ